MTKILCKCGQELASLMKKYLIMLWPLSGVGELGNWNKVLVNLGKSRKLGKMACCLRQGETKGKFWKIMSAAKTFLYGLHCKKLSLAEDKKSGKKIFHLDQKYSTGK